MEEEEASSKQNITKPEAENGLGLSMLIDSQNNQYILTKPRDATIPRADHHFIKASVHSLPMGGVSGWATSCGPFTGASGLPPASVPWAVALGSFSLIF